MVEPDEDASPRPTEEAPNAPMTRAGVVLSVERVLPLVSITGGEGANERVIVGMATVGRSTASFTDNVQAASLTEYARVAVDVSLTGLTLGALAGVGYVSQGDSGSVTLGARLGYVVPIGRRIALWPRLVVGMITAKETNAILSADVAFAFFPTSHFAISVGPSAQRYFLDAEVNRFAVDTGVLVTW